jgi:hypothetical protein
MAISKNEMLTYMGITFFFQNCPASCWNNFDLSHVLQLYYENQQRAFPTMGQILEIAPNPCRVSIWVDNHDHPKKSIFDFDI